MTTAARCLALVAWVVPLLAQGASVEIHPAGDEVPENLLRLELRFDRPQRLPFDMGRLALVDETGAEIQHALLDTALSDAQGRRITVLMDPGRVKTGVGPNLEAGRALTRGRVVSLRVRGDENDPTPAVKQWRVVEAVTQPLQPERWQVLLPRAGTREDLSVDLRMPISSAGERLIAVVDHQGRRVSGVVTLADGDATWRFKPARPWAHGPHRLVTHPDLEDPAGNRRCAAFETEIRSASACEGATLDFDL